MKLLNSGIILSLAAASLNLSFARPKAANTDIAALQTAAAAGGFLSVSWTKRGFDQGNTNWNRTEPFLTAGNVNPATFGKLWEKTIAGQVYSQPLYVSGLPIQGALRDVVFVATENNDVYALDARTSNQLWHSNLGPSVPSGTVGCGDLAPQYGITSTPVIQGTERIYLAAKTLELGVQRWRLHALSLTTGREVTGWGFIIQGSLPGSPPIVFKTEIQLNRCGLALANNNVYVGFGSHCDIALNQYHGWVFAYNIKKPALGSAIWTTTPSSNGNREQAGGLWMAGGAPAFDENGDMYLMTGNGPMDADLDGGSIGDAFVHVRTNRGLSMAFSGAPSDYFSPSNQGFLDAVDADLGSGGLLLIPTQAGLKTPRMIVGGGKDALLRLLNRDDMGAFTGRANPNAPNNVLQEVPFGNGFWSCPAFADAGGGPCVYAMAVGDLLKQYRLGPDAKGKGHLTFVAQGPTGAGYPSSTPVVSSMGPRAGTGVVWVLNRGNNALLAYDARDVSREIYSSQTNSTRDGIAIVVKFTVPTVVKGRVFVGGDNKIYCYGLL